jgi:hypothetical protein
VTDKQDAGVQRFPIRIGRRSAPLLLAIFGARERNSYVDISATELYARFGLYHLRMPISNIAKWRIEGPWLWITAIGLRRGWSGDITFAGNRGPGLRIDLHKAEQRSILRIPRLYVTVADLDGLSRALTNLGINGEDARRAQ